MSEITPQTLSRWKKEPAFIAEMESMKQDLRNGLTERLILLADHSLAALEKELRSSGSGKTALAVLKLLGEAQFALRCVLENAPASAEEKKNL